jgi:hypothetical protein
VKTPEQIITGALEALGSNGEHWTQGRQRDRYGNMCLIGALRQAAVLYLDAYVDARDAEKLYRDAYVEYCYARDAVDAVICSEYGDDLETIFWNDDPERQFAEVRAVLEKARANVVHH